MRFFLEPTLYTNQDDVSFEHIADFLFVVNSHFRISQNIHFEQECSKQKTKKKNVFFLVFGAPSIFIKIEDI